MRRRGSRKAGSMAGSGSQQNLRERNCSTPQQNAGTPACWCSRERWEGAREATEVRKKKARSGVGRRERAPGRQNLETTISIPRSPARPPCLSCLMSKSLCPPESLSKRLFVNATPYPISHHACHREVPFTKISSSTLVGRGRNRHGTFMHGGRQKKQRKACYRERERRPQGRYGSAVRRKQPQVQKCPMETGRKSRQEPVQSQRVCKWCGEMSKVSKKCSFQK